MKGVNWDQVIKSVTTPQMVAQTERELQVVKSVQSFYDKYQVFPAFVKVHRGQVTQDEIVRILRENFTAGTFCITDDALMQKNPASGRRARLARELADVIRDMERRLTQMKAALSPAA